MRPALLCAALALFASGRAAGGDPEAPEVFRAEVPDWWRQAPELVPSLAETSGVEIAALRAWADPSSGCFALVQVIDAAEEAEAATALGALRRELGETVASVSEVGKSRSPGLRLAIESGELRGEVVALTAKSRGALRIGSAACFYNPREPAVSEQLCRRMLESFEVVP